MTKREIGIAAAMAVVGVAVALVWSHIAWMDGACPRGMIDYTKEVTNPHMRVVCVLEEPNVPKLVTGPTSPPAPAPAPPAEPPKETPRKSAK